MSIGDSTVSEEETNPLHSYECSVGRVPDGMPGGGGGTAPALGVRGPWDRGAEGFSGSAQVPGLRP